jgi:hypothetical protein
MRGVAIALAFAAVAGCGVLPFDVGQDIAEQKVPGSVVGGILPSFIPTPIPITINIQSETARRGTGPARSAGLSSLTLSATRSSGTFDFLDEVHIFISSPNDTALPKREIATLKPVPRGATTVSFTPTDVDLLPYINAGSQIDSQAMGTQPKSDFFFDGHLVVTARF